MLLSPATDTAASGAHVTSLNREDVKRLGEAIRLSGLLDVSLEGRLSVVFAYPGMGVGDVYPELAGCTSEVCAFIEESAVFEKHGIQVIGLSTEPSEPPPGCLAIPFPTGLLPQHGVGSPLDFVQKAERRYAVRASFIVGPDGTGERITDIENVVGHVRRCFQLAMDRRLARYRDAVMEHLSNEGNGLRPNVALRGFLPNGADSVAIHRVDVTFELVTKLADRAIISQEAGHIRRINRLLVDAGRSELFPTVLAICDTEDPAWYLMEAADPTKLDEIVFADRARTKLSDAGKATIDSAVDKLIALYQLTVSPKDSRQWRATTISTGSSSCHSVTISETPSPCSRSGISRRHSASRSFWATDTAASRIGSTWVSSRHTSISWCSHSARISTGTPISPTCFFRPTGRMSASSIRGWFGTATTSASRDSATPCTTLERCSTVFT